MLWWPELQNIKKKMNSFAETKCLDFERGISSFTCSNKEDRAKRFYVLSLFFSILFSVANTTDSLAASGLGSHRNWLQGLDSPLIHPSEEESGQKELKLRFDVSQYSPEEIVVKTVDNKLLVSKILKRFKYSRTPQLRKVRSPGIGHGNRDHETSSKYVGSERFI